MRSPLSSRPIAAAGTTVTATARIRTSEPGRVLRFRIQEVNAGSPVTSRTTIVRPSSRGWYTVTTSIRTKKAASRVRLYARGTKIRSRNFVRIRNISVVATAAPTVPSPTPTPTPTPTVPTPSPTNPQPSLCEDIDYSDPEQGELTFADEFEGTSIDRDTWRVRDNTFLNQDRAWITKDAVSVSDGALNITGKRLPESEWRTNLNALYPDNLVRDYSTGYVDTIDSAGFGNAERERFGQKYGHFEVRAWVPSAATASRGIWPAFWLRADDKPGEIDVIESYGGKTIKSFDPSSSYEWNSWHDTLQQMSKDHTWGRADVGDDKIWQGWHRFGVNWSPDCLRYLYDGKTVGLVDFNDPDTKSYFRGDTFDSTFHLRINMQVGSKYWGWASPEHTRDEFTYKVDWVRVYQGKELLNRP